MNRISLLATLAVTILFAGASWAQETVTAPCMDKPNDEALNVCLQEVLDSGVKILVPDCSAETGEAREACNTKAKAYQKKLAELTGNECAGLQGEKLTACKEGMKPSGSKKGGLEKHSGTKMERMGGTGDEEE